MGLFTVVRNMKKAIITIIFSFISILTFSQTLKYDEIKMLVLDEAGPLPGVSIIIEKSINDDVFNTDFDGEVKIKIRKDLDLVRLSFMGPIIRIKILRPTDSIKVNLLEKKAYYYDNGKRIKKRKIKVSGY